MDSKPTLQQLSLTFNQFIYNWQVVQNDSTKFSAITGIYCGIINKVALEHIPFYVDEYYMKVAAVYDAVDTLEFGKMRSETQKLLHKSYIAPDIRGAFLASAYEGEKEIALSNCSHEGLKFQLKILKRDLERDTDDHTNPDFVIAMDKIEDLENRIAVASRDINMYRLKIINLSKESLQTALHKSQNRRFCLNADSYYMDGNYGCFEGFKCEYYKKSSGKEKKVNYKILLYSMLEAAHTANRDLYAEIRNLTVPSAPDYSHDELLTAYHVSLDDAVASDRQLKETLAAHAEELKIQRAKSRAILEAREAENNSLTDPDAIRERDEAAAAADKLIRSIIGGVRVAGDSSDEDDDLDHDSDETSSGNKNKRSNEVETAPQFPDDASTSSNSVPKELIKSKLTTKLNKSRKEPSKKSEHSSVKTSSASPIRGTYKKYKRYYSPSSKARRKDDDYSSTDSEASSNRTSLPQPKQQSEPSKKKARHGSSFLEPPVSPVDSERNTPPIAAQKNKSKDCSVDKVRLNHCGQSQSMLQQVQGSICEVLQSKKRVLSRHMFDNSEVAEYDPTFPDLDGHPHNDSLLHEIDERLVHLDDSDEDAEMEDEDNHTVNVGWGRMRSDSPMSTDISGTKTKNTKREVDPEKAQRQQAVHDAAAAKKEEKRLEAKVRREEAVFQRRVLEANNNGRNSQKSETDEDQNLSSRKRRATSGISASWTGFYGVNLALNQAQLRNSELIKGCANHVLGENPSSSSSSSSSSSLQRSDEDYAVVLSYRKQSGAVCDRVLKQKLMKHLQLDIFKEITFERLITEYSVAKRESVGVADDEIIDIDWFEVMDGFSVNLKQRLSANSRVILNRIHTAIDDDNNVTAKFAMKERFTKSMNAFLRHGYRTINSIITKTVHKIGSHFDSLNFSDALPRYETFGHKTQGYAFSFTASLYNVFEENTAALTTGGDMFGVDPLLCEIMKSSTNENHMADVIEYTLIKKSRYTDSPASYTALRKYLDKRNKGASAHSAATADSSVATASGLQSNNNTTSISTTSSHSTTLSEECVDISAAREELWSTNTTTPSHTSSASSHHNFSASVTSPSNYYNTSLKSNEPSASESMLLEADVQSTNNDINKQLFGTVDDVDSIPNNTQLRHDGPQGFINKFLPIVIDNNADQSATENPGAASLCSQVVAGLRQFLLLLLSDVKHHDANLYLKLNTKHNIRVTRNLSLMKFLEENVRLDDVALYDLFCGSQYFKNLSCVLMIPFSLEDQYNIIGDGYCFYRALFMLMLRDQSGNAMSAEQLRELDVMLKNAGEDGEKLRNQFQDFYARLEQLFPDPKAKAKVAAASCTFSNLATYLDERFWGGSDSVPFLDFSCTAFSYNKDEATHLTGTWAKMYCSSIPGLVNGRDTVNYSDVGNAYSLSDVLAVVMRPHNWLLHKHVHFFVADHPTVDTHLQSFAANLSSILSELRLRLAVAKGEDSVVTFTDVYDRMVSGKSTTADVLWLNETKNALERQLTEQNFFFGEDEEPVAAAPVTSTKQMEAFLATPFGATQEQKIYISTINNTVAVKESENELLRTQLAGLKEMIARNSASVKCPIFIDCEQ